MTDLVGGSDGRLRCRWGASTPEYEAYHDTEWGFPVGDDRRIYEKLCLEGFQAGLSWLTILRKRDGFRRAFAGFDPVVVAGFDEADEDRLMGDAAIVRNRLKIRATIANARAAVQLAAGGRSLAALVWQHQPAEPHHPQSFHEVPPVTSESRALSKELQRHGFRFVGPTTVYAAMQSLGVVDDHLGGCAIREAAEAARRNFRIPVPG